MKAKHVAVILIAGALLASGGFAWAAEASVSALAPSVVVDNRAQFNAFRDTQNNPSVPYQLVFETRQ